MGKSFTNPIGAVTNIGTMGLVGYDGKKFGRGVISEGANQASGGKISEVGNQLADSLLGERTPGTPDEVIDMADPLGREHQRTAIGKFGEMLNQDVGQLSRIQTGQLEKQAMAGANDQERLAKQMVAQRGLGNSSVGLNAILNQKADLGNKIGSIRANQPMLENQMKQQNLQFASGGINQILNEQGQSKVLKMGQQAQGRSGGIVGALMPVAGSVLGGVAGSGGFNKYF